MDGGDQAEGDDLVAELLVRVVDVDGEPRFVVEARRGVGVRVREPGQLVGQMIGFLVSDVPTLAGFFAEGSERAA